MANNSNQRKTRQKRKVIIFSIEIVVLLAMVAVLYVVMTKTNSKGPSYTVVEPQNVTSPEVQQKKEEGNMKIEEYWNIALYGVDAKRDSQLYKGSNSDCIMICSINKTTGDIKLVSVYRDTLMNIGNDQYYKCNRAYMEGGYEQSLKMLNMNLDMDITDFVTVGYKGLMEVIDGLGGVYIDVDFEEMVHLNNYQKTIVTDVDGINNYIEVKEPGYQLLNGLQAAAYCRIRKTKGDDFKRAERQREVIKAIEEQAKKEKNPQVLINIFNNAIDDIFTSLDPKDIIALLPKIADYRIVEEGGFPDESMRTTGNIGAKGSCVVPLNLEDNVVWLHKFLFEEQDYSVTANVAEYSEEVASLSAPYIK
ncbi:MAG: LCP family protein [Lachnoclostridium sp.]|nr:LCP family protein [Lachnospira sp.]MCM1247766.1 LCP family protein [Lachnoclostridium sp.]MCM1534313.1 LCP family protein [Clostridium sp.]